MGFKNYIDPTLSAEQVEELKEIFPNLDETVRYKDIDETISSIDSYLERKPHCSDREQMLNWKKELNKILRRNQ